jgi:hypothetical protein
VRVSQQKKIWGERNEPQQNVFGESSEPQQKVFSERSASQQKVFDERSEKNKVSEASRYVYRKFLWNKVIVSRKKLGGQKFACGAVPQGLTGQTN